MTCVMSCQIGSDGNDGYVTFDLHNPVDRFVRWMWLGAEIFNGGMAIRLDEVDFYRRCIEK